MSIWQPITNKGYQLFHEGSIALAEVEANGIRIDTEYLERAKVECKEKIRELKASLLANEVYEEWRRRFGPDTKLGNRDQLATVLFDILKLPCTKYTKSSEKKAKKRPAMDDEVLRNIEVPFVQTFLDLGRWQKAQSTYLRGIEREVIDGFIHPVFNLHLVSTFRSSSDHPNFQNIPVRRPEIAKLIRSAFIPRNDHRQLVEYDFKGIEVSVAACYNHDPVLVRYVSDDTTDMHRDVGCECYIVTEDEITKLIRYAAKNRFTFPEFYGNWYKAVARDLWRAIDELKLTTKDGTPLKKHLQRKGIKELGECDPEKDPVEGTFEYHIKQVEDDFWGRRFKVYDQWKGEWNEAYMEHGYFDTLTGFRCSALMDRKQSVNYPIQGSAFHCLLWSLIRVQKLLKRYKLRSLIVGQIHDSMIMDVSVQEMRDVIDIVRQVTMHDLAKHWDWIIVPMRIECEAAPAGKSWYEKKEIKL